MSIIYFHSIIGPRLNFQRFVTCLFIYNNTEKCIYHRCYFKEQSRQNKEVPTVGDFKTKLD